MTDNVRIYYDGTHPDTRHHPAATTVTVERNTIDPLTSLDDDPHWALYIPDSGPLENDDPPIC